MFIFLAPMSRFFAIFSEIAHVYNIHFSQYTHPMGSGGLPRAAVMGTVT